MPDLETRKSTELPHEPGNWPRLFEQYLNAGDLDAVTALYEPEARFVARSGETIVGSGPIRKVLAGLITANTHLQCRVLKAVTIDNAAVLYTNFEGTTVDHSGNTVPIRSKAIEVLRRQPNGDWKLIVGDPNGRETEMQKVRTWPEGTYGP
ncbi:MAG TPA: nuclear transport factor 2 family protein [Terrimicrobiaceae bacterium]